jgi:hypothetical protein
MRLARRLVPLAALAVVIVGGTASPDPGEHASLSALDRAQRDGIDIANVLETVRHRVRVGGGRMAAEDARYRLELSGQGFAVRLRARGSQSRPLAPMSRRPDHARRRADRPLTVSFDPASAFEMRVSRVRGPTGAVDVRPQSWTRYANRVWRTIAPGVREQVTAREGRLDWRFRLGRSLAGPRPISLEADVSAALQPLRTGRSWLWRDPSGRSVRVGKLTVENAKGERVGRGIVGARGSKVLIDVPSVGIPAEEYPLTVGLTVSPEYPASEIVYIPSFDSETPRVAWGGGQYLVVWNEWRAEPGDVSGTRVTPEGEVLDLGGIPILIQPEQQLYPTVASDGEDFLVVWTDYADYGVYGKRVAAEGTVLDPAPIRISPAAVEGESPSVSWGGENYFVAWTDYRSGGSGAGIYGTRVSSDGVVLDVDGIAISTAPGDKWAPALAWSGTQLLVTWEDARNSGSSGWDIYGSRVTASGQVLDPSGIPVSTAQESQFASAVASSGENFLVAWQDRRLGTSADRIYGARVADDGTVLDASGIAISTGAGRQGDPAVASDGADFLVVWYREPINDIYGSRVSGAGVVLDPEGIPIAATSDDQFYVEVVYGDSNYLVVWNDTRFGSSVGVFMARVSSSGQVLDPDGIPASTMPTWQDSAAIAWDGETYLVVWGEGRSGSDDIYAGRLSADGELLDGAGIAVSTAPGDQDFPSVAWNGSNYLVVWIDEPFGSRRAFRSRPA